MSHDQPVTLEHELAVQRELLIQDTSPADSPHKQLMKAFSKALGETPDPQPSGGFPPIARVHFEAASPTMEGMAKIIREHQAEIARRQDEEIMLFLQSIPEERWGWISAIHCFDRQGVWGAALPRFTPQLVKPRTLRERWRSLKQRKAIATYVAELRKDHR